MRIEHMAMYVKNIDVREARIGDHCMIGPGTLITKDDEDRR